MNSDTDTKHTAVEQSESGITVVMDGYGEWSPFAAFREASEAIRLREMLSADADAVCGTAPYFEGKESVIDGEPTDPPDNLEEVCVAWSGKDVLGLGDNWGAREVAFRRNGGPRKTVPIYDTAEEVVEDRPAAVGQFIAAEMTAEDLMEALR